MALEQTDYTEAEQTRQALDTLIYIQQMRLDELKQLQGNPEAIDLYFAQGHKDYDALIQKAGKENPKVLELSGQLESTSPEPKVLREAKAEAEKQYTPEENIRLRAQAKQREFFNRIFQAIEPDLNEDEKEKLKRVMDEQIAAI